MGKATAVYAVRVGRKTGIFQTWGECKEQVHGYPGAVHKKCASEAEAQQWLDEFRQSSRNVFAEPLPSKRTFLNARASAAPYSVPSSSTRSLGKHGAQKPGELQELEDAQADTIVAYTDGASKNNQSATNRIAGYGIHWARGRPADVQSDIAARCPGASNKTNNFGELLAIIRTLELTRDDPRPLRIYSDSKYSIDTFGWVNGWKRNGWQKKDGSPIANLPMVRYMDGLRRLRVKRGWTFEINHVKGHASSVGNNTADALANQGCLMPISETEPDWNARRQEVEELISQAQSQEGSPQKAAVAIKETANEVSLRTGPVKPPANNATSADDFSDIYILDDAELLAELSS